jgi:hypothetical protein
MKNILEYDHTEARRFFLKEESYFNFDLPTYFTFQPLLNKVSNKLQGKRLSDFYSTFYNSKKDKNLPTFPQFYENVNYEFLNNKDGKYAWRPFQLIHPAIYCSLVHNMTTSKNWNFITKRFKKFNSDERIRCLSIPIESETESSDKSALVFHWWQEIEQKSLEMAINYEYLIHTDISDCYGSLYTHSIAWAIHTKARAKAERQNKYLIGNIIDNHLQYMSFGQTNGIPQGSVLMDFIAEMVLGYADLLLSERTNKAGLSNFLILRYRDDYRIFTNNPQEAEFILKQLTEILIELGMRINTEKTHISNNIIQDSIKPDKTFWMNNQRWPKRPQEKLIVIHSLAQKYPNSGSLNKVLTKFFEGIKNLNDINDNIYLLINILTDIVYKNPRTYPISAAILSKFLSFIEPTEEKKNLLKIIHSKFEKIPNTAYLKIWLQRITYIIDDKISYNEYLCKKVTNSDISIWNSDWLNEEMKKLITNQDVVDRKILMKMKPIIDTEEVGLFITQPWY